MSSRRSMGRSVLVVILASDLGLGSAFSWAQTISEEVIEQARDAYWEGRFEESIALLEPVLRTSGEAKTLGQAAFLSGLDYFALGDTERGRSFFDSAVKHDPDFTPDPGLYPPDVVDAYASARLRGRKVAGARDEAPQPGRTEADPSASSRAPSTPTRPPEEFEKVKLMVNEGDEARETDAILRLEEGRLSILSEDETPLKVMAYDQIRSAEYSYSKHPRWKAGIGAAVAVGVFALPLFFMKGKRHWLTLQTEDDFAILRLDKKNYRLVRLAFEARSGIPVETAAEEDK